MAKMCEFLKNPRINEISHVGAAPAIYTQTRSLSITLFESSVLLDQLRALAQVSLCY